MCTRVFVCMCLCVWTSSECVVIKVSAHVYNYSMCMCVWQSSECVVSKVSAHVFVFVCMYMSVCLDEFRVYCFPSEFTCVHVCLYVCVCVFGRVQSVLLLK
jgi:hypothetical protein